MYTLIKVIERGDKLNEKLRKLREEKGLTQEELAKKINLSQQGYSRIENGKNPSFPTALKIAAFFKKEIKEVF